MIALSPTSQVESASKDISKQAEKAKNKLSSAAEEVRPADEPDLLPAACCWVCTCLNAKLGHSNHSDEKLPPWHGVTGFLKAANSSCGATALPGWCGNPTLDARRFAAAGHRQGRVRGEEDRRQGGVRNEEHRQQGRVRDKEDRRQCGVCDKEVCQRHLRLSGVHILPFPLRTCASTLRRHTGCICVVWHSHCWGLQLRRLLRQTELPGTEGNPVMLGEKPP